VDALSAVMQPKGLEWPLKRGHCFMRWQAQLSVFACHFYIISYKKIDEQTCFCQTSFLYCMAI
jgi:hypothetical protein